MVLTFQQATFSIFALLEVGTYLLVWMFLNGLRRCPLTVASQLRDEKRVSVRPHLLDSTPCGASSTVSKEGCLIVQGAAR